MGTPLLIHQPSYSLLNRWIEDGLLDTLGELGVGCIVFSPLAQGMLTDRYLNGIPADSRAAQHGSLSPDLLTDTLGELGVGCIVFSPLAQGMLTDRYLNGIPADSRAAQHGSLSPDLLTDEALARIRALNEIATGRGQSLAQLAIAWTLRDPRVTSALIGASSVEQLEANIAALERLDFSHDELAEIDRHAVDSNINIWAASSRE